VYGLNQSNGITRHIQTLILPQAVPLLSILEIVTFFPAGQGESAFLKLIEVDISSLHAHVEKSGVNYLW